MTDAGDLDRAQIMWGKWHRGDLLRHSAVWGWWRCARSRWGWACCLPMIRWQMDSDARQDRPATPPTNGSCCCWEETGGQRRVKKLRNFYRFPGGFQLKSFDCWSKSFSKEVKQICLGVKQWNEAVEAAQPASFTQATASHTRLP